MSNSSNKIIATLKEYYEEISGRLLAGKKGIDQFLFGTDNRSTAAEFNLDKYVRTPHGVCFRHPDDNSVVRKYTPGVGIFYDIPHASEVTPISESLRDSIIVGVQDNAGFDANKAKLMADILVEHTVAHTITRWKLALDVFRTGKFSPKGIKGRDIGGLEIDFSRDSSLSTTYDFTASGATIDLALKDLIDKYRAKGGNTANVCVLMGSKWLAELESDDDVLVKMQANTANTLIRMNLNPPEFMNVQGLNYIGEYRVQGVSFPVSILTYEQQDQFTAYVGASAVDYLPSDEAIIFSSSDKRYRVFGGIDALNDAGKPVRVQGAEIVFDSFFKPDPVAEMIRSQSRYAFVPANVDHIAISTGTFAAS